MIYPYGVRYTFSLQELVSRVWLRQEGDGSVLEIKSSLIQVQYWYIIDRYSPSLWRLYDQDHLYCPIQVHLIGELIVDDIIPGLGKLFYLIQPVLPSIH